MDKCPYCQTEYNDERDENGMPFCDCLEAENAALRERVRGLESILREVRTHARTVNNGKSYDPTKLIDKPELDKLLEGNDE